MTHKDAFYGGGTYQPARWIGGDIVPEIVILHDTASPLEPGNAAGYLRDNNAKVSVHFVIERDGGIVQQVPVNKRANHAGRSEYHGRKYCNAFSIGIELVNPGRMTKAANPGRARAWWGEEFDIEQYGIQAITTKAHGPGLWMPHTEAQIYAAETLLRDLFGEISTLTDITTHWYVSPGRKVDPNPLFPLEQIRARVLGRDAPIAPPADAISQAPDADDALVTIATQGDTLNMRRWPSFNPNIIGAIPDGTSVLVLRKGRFDGRDWLRVLYGGVEGWIVKAYTNT